MRRSAVRGLGAGALVGSLALGGAALGVALTSGGGASAGEPSGACAASAPKLTVQGTGQASATPNLLTVTVGIDVTDPGARAALVDDNGRASAVTAALEQGGVQAKDIQTSDLSIEPSYGNNGVITGYEMNNVITAQLHDLATAGSVVDAVTTAAGNAARIDSLTFSIEDQRTIEDRARADAVSQAVSHARSMARAAGERLGPVCSLTDDSDNGSDVVYPSAVGAALGNSAASSVPLEPGTQQSTGKVTLVYALEQARPAR